MTWEHRDLVFLSAECTISAVSVVANGLVLSALWRFPSLRTTTNTLIGSLTLSDLLVSCVVGPTSAMTFHGVPQNLYGCIFFNCLAIVFTNVNVLNLLLITIERFLAVKYPIMHRRKVTNRKARIAIGVAWLTGMLIGFVPLMGWYRRGEFSDCSFTAVIPLTFMVYVIFLGVVLPCLVFMIFVYTIIYLIFRRRHQSGNIRTLSRPSKLGKQENPKQKRYVKCTVALVLVFAINWLPIHTSNSLTVFQSINSPLELVYVFVYLSHTSAIINPFIYAFYIKSFRRAIKRMLECYCIPSQSLQKSLNAPTITTKTFLQMRDERRKEEFTSDVGVLVMKDKARKEGTLTTSTVSVVNMEDKSKPIERLPTSGGGVVDIEDKNRTERAPTTNAGNASDTEDKNRTIQRLTTSGGGALETADKNRTIENLPIGGESSVDTEDKNRTEETPTTKRENALETEAEDKTKTIGTLATNGGSTLDNEDKKITTKSVTISEGSADDKKDKSRMEGASVTNRASALDVEDENRTRGALTTRRDSVADQKDKSGGSVSDSSSSSSSSSVVYQNVYDFFS